MRFRIDDIGRVRFNLATGGAFDAIRTTTLVQLRMTHGVGSREAKVEYAAMLLGRVGYFARPHDFQSIADADAAVGKLLCRPQP
jgi:hypothetical protein